MAVLLAWLCWHKPVAADDSPASSSPPAAGPGAEPAQRPIPKAQLNNLAWQFLNQVGKSLKVADLMMSGAGKVTLAEKLSGTQIPEGEPLLLQVFTSRYRLPLQQDIIAIKQGPRLMVSLGEFSVAADFAISVNPADGTAQGWFIREDQRFFLDARKGEVTIMNDTSKIDPLDISLTESDLLVSSVLLEKWFGLSIDYDFADLSLKIRTSQPFPIEAKYLRGLLDTDNNFNVGPAKLPLLEEPPRLMSKPFLDTNMNLGRTKSAGPAQAYTFGTWATFASGDMAGYTGQAFASGTRLTPLNTARLTLSRTDPEGNLLGPLQATGYQFGDIGIISLPLIDLGGQEQGVSLTNTPLDVSMQSTTVIRGNALPDWDVELYRNDTFIEIQRIDGTGQYEFKDVILFIGNNDFKIVSYGPQGEVRQEDRQILVDPQQYKSRKGYYAVSASRLNTTTWQKTPITSPGTGSPHLVGNYAYSFGNIGTGSIGARLRNDNGENRIFVQTGLSTYIHDTYISAESGYDPSEFEYTSVLTARRNFGLHRGLLHFSTNSDGYDIENALTSSPGIVKYGVRASMAGPLDRDQIFSLKNLTYSTSANYSTLYNGYLTYGLSSSVTGRYNKTTSVSSGFRYTGGGNDEFLAWSLNARGYYKGGLWSLGTSHQLLPQNRLGGLVGEYAWTIKDNLSAKAAFTQGVDPLFTEGSLALNWRTDKAVISPKIKVNTQKALDMTVNVRFGLAPEPYSGSYQMTHKSMSGVGGVAARIFLDMNGDGIFNNNEELLSDTTIKAAQSFRKAVSNERGIAFINDLSPGIVTDVSVDPQTLPDISFLSLFEGISVNPRPGIVSQIEFPVVISGEIDGTGYIPIGEKGKAPARNVMMVLTAPDGRIEKTAQTAFDGYYSFSNIRPGVYYLNIDPLKSEGKSYMIPKKLVFSPQGTVLYDYQPALVRGYDVPFRFSSLDKPQVPFNRARVEKEEDIAGEEVLVRLGPYYSRLALTFSWYRFKIRTIPWGAYFSLATPLAKINPDPKTGGMEIVLKPRQPFGLQEGAQACQTLQDMRFDCSVEVVTHYSFARAPAVAAALCADCKQDLGAP